MADQIAVDQISDFDGLPTPQLDYSFLSDDVNNTILSFDDDVLDYLNFDDVELPSDTQDFLNSDLPTSFPVDITSDPNDSLSNTEFSDVLQLADDPNVNVAGYFNVSPSESGEKSSKDVPEDPKCSSVDVRVSGDSQLNFSSSDSRDWSPGSENYKHLNVSGDVVCESQKLGDQIREFSGQTSSQGSDNCASSAKFGDGLANGVVGCKVKLEEPSKNQLLKRKKENEEDVNSESTRTIKYRKSSNVGGVTTDESNVCSDTNDDEKRKARLMRNRESAQLSRQRKKHYVEELEDKVREMHTTIQDLNAKISYIVAENAALRQQQIKGGSGSGGPPPMQGMYPHPPMAPMGYPWMPCPPYMLKPQGSQVPLVPIPRLKPRQEQTKPTKREGSKKNEGSKTNVGKSKTKKVASVSFLGILFFMLLFGGLVPMVNMRYGGLQDAINSGSSYIGNKVYYQHRDRILMVDKAKYEYGAKGPVKDFNNTIHCGRDHVGGAESNIKQSSSEEFARSGNTSEPLVASLYVPRNDKLVKIDGNLIIHSILASEKAKASHDDKEAKNDRSDRETSRAVALNLVPSISVQGAGHNTERKSHIYPSTIEQQRALASGSMGEDNLKSSPADGKLQQWFREGLAGPMLSSGMCTEVFQFDVSPTPGAIVPATPSSRNISMEERNNSTHLNKGKNRRILHGLSIPYTRSPNISKEETASKSEKEKSHRNTSVSPMIVSVLVDPREVGDANGDGIIGTKSLSKIFVVVLLDSVKYVTYSCMLPFKGSSHLVTA